MKKTLLTLLWTLLSLSIFSQNYTISGFVSEKQSGERLLNANVYDAKNLKGVTANTYGFYSITLPKGQIEITASYIGYQNSSTSFELKSDTTINFRLILNSEDIETVTVYGNASKNKVESTEISVNELTGATIDKLPVIMGEADVLKVMQLLPGVQGGVEGTSGIYVRGGGPDQNLFLLDGVPVYNASHLMGFFSVFNPDAIKTVKTLQRRLPCPLWRSLIVGRRYFDERWKHERVSWRFFSWFNYFKTNARRSLGKRQNLIYAFGTTNLFRCIPETTYCISKHEVG